MVRPSFVKLLNTEEESIGIKDTIIEAIWYNQPFIFLRKVGRFIKRLFRWVPVLWKQEEWDFGYTYEILELKLKEIQESIKEDTWHDPVEVEEALNQISSCLDHLDKYLNWTNYISIPSGEKHVKTGAGFSIKFTQEQEEAFKKVREFEEEHYNAFWDELKKNSGNWWT